MDAIAMQTDKKEIIKKIEHNSEILETILNNVTDIQKKVIKNDKRVGELETLVELLVSKFDAQHKLTQTTLQMINSNSQKLEEIKTGMENFRNESSKISTGQNELNDIVSGQKEDICHFLKIKDDFATKQDQALNDSKNIKDELKSLKNYIEKQEKARLETLEKEYEKISSLRIEIKKQRDVMVESQELLEEKVHEHFTEIKVSIQSQNDKLAEQAEELDIQRNGYKKRRDFPEVSEHCEYLKRHVYLGAKVKPWRPDMNEKYGTGTVIRIDEYDKPLCVYFNFLKDHHWFDYADVEIDDEH